MHTHMCIYVSPHAHVVYKALMHDQNYSRVKFIVHMFPITYMYMHIIPSIHIYIYT